MTHKTTDDFLRGDRGKVWGEYDDPSCGQKIIHPGGQAFFSYWRENAKNGKFLEKNEIDLRMIRHAVPWLALLELSEKKYVWRLAGTSLCQVWGRELTGEDFLASWEDFERQILASLLEKVAQGQPAVVRFSAIYCEDEGIGFEMVATPVACGKAEHQIFAALMPFHDPYWLQNSTLKNLELTSIRVLENLDGCKRPSLSNVGIVPKTPLKGQLRVIEGGKKD